MRGRLRPWSTELMLTESSSASSATRHPLPSLVMIMGVSGCGKSTIGLLLAERLQWEFENADRFHPKSNIDKMHNGIPLTDEDRWPWLLSIAAWIDEPRQAGKHVALA